MKFAANIPHIMFNIHFKRSYNKKIDGPEFDRREFLI